MTANLAQNITTPSCFRPFFNGGAAEIKPGYILKHNGARQDADVATAATQTLIGISVETLKVGAPARSVQVDGVARVRAGEALTAGDPITTDSTGRAIAATPTIATPQNIIGYATDDSAGADDGSDKGTSWIGVELKAPGQLLFLFNWVADRTALKAIPAAERTDGMRVTVLSDHSEWIFRSASTAAEDTADELVQVPGAGSGRWLRFDKAFIMKIPIGFANTNGQAIETIPAGFALRITGMPFWDVTTAWTGGSSAAIGLSTNITGYEVGGDLLGGATGDVLADLDAGLHAGTIGDEMSDNVGLQAMLLVEDSEIQFDRINDAFTAGAGFACIPVVQCIPA